MQRVSGRQIGSHQNHRLARTVGHDVTHTVEKSQQTVSHVANICRTFAKHLAILFPQHLNRLSHYIINHIVHAKLLAFHSLHDLLFKQHVLEDEQMRIKNFSYGNACQCEGTIPRAFNRRAGLRQRFPETLTFTRNLRRRDLARYDFQLFGHKQVYSPDGYAW